TLEVRIKSDGGTGFSRFFEPDLAMTFVERLRDTRPIWRRLIAAGSLFLCVVVACLLIATYGYAQPERLNKPRDVFREETSHGYMPPPPERPPYVSPEKQKALHDFQCKLHLLEESECKEQKPSKAELGRPDQRQPGELKHLESPREHSGAQRLRQPEQ